MKKNKNNKAARLIKCIKCGEKISGLARICPHCVNNNNQ